MNPRRRFVPWITLRQCHQHVSRGSLENPRHQLVLLMPPQPPNPKDSLALCEVRQCQLREQASPKSPVPMHIHFLVAQTPNGRPTQQAASLRAVTRDPGTHGPPSSQWTGPRGNGCRCGTISTSGLEASHPVRSLPPATPTCPGSQDINPVPTKKGKMGPPHGPPGWVSPSPTTCSEQHVSDGTGTSEATCPPRGAKSRTGRATRDSS